MIFLNDRLFNTFRRNPAVLSNTEMMWADKISGNTLSKTLSVLRIGRWRFHGQIKSLKVVA